MVINTWSKNRTERHSHASPTRSAREEEKRKKGEKEEENGSNGSQPGRPFFPLFANAPWPFFNVELLCVRVCSCAKRGGGGGRSRGKHLEGRAESSVSFLFAATGFSRQRGRRRAGDYRFHRPLSALISPLSTRRIPPWPREIRETRQDGSQLDSFGLGTPGISVFLGLLFDHLLSGLRGRQFVGNSR